MKKYCFTKKEMEAIVEYFNFAIEKDMLIDKDEFVNMINNEIDHDIWG